MTAGHAEPSGAVPDETRLRRDSQRIEELLDELGELAAAPAYQRIEELVQRLVRLYGAGLERLLEVALAGEGSDAALRRVCADDLVAGLLLIHGLHPRSAADRVAAALAGLGRQLGRRLELIEIDGAGVARVRIDEPTDHTGLIERAVIDAAPELSAVAIEGAGSPDLVQIDLARSRRSG